IREWVSVDVALLILRVLIALLLAGHGSQRLFGWFAGYGLPATGSFLEAQGFRPGRLWALLAGLGELGGGVLFALGLLSPLGGLAIAAAMFVAIVRVHGPNGPWAQNNGFEYPLVLLAIGLVVAAA